MRNSLADPSFDDLLAWLHSDRDMAGQQYETIRAGLIRIFVAKGFSDAEDLADDTITRVTKKVREIRDGYVGQPARYFHGVARNVIWERYRLKEIATETIEVVRSQISNQTALHECLQRCLNFLSPEKGELIMDYYAYDGHDKIEQRKGLATELGISEGALRNRAHQIRNKLEKCVRECTEGLEKGNERSHGKHSN